MVARERRVEARKLIAAGIDPSQRRKEEKVAAARSAKNTFGVAVNDYLDHLEAGGLAEATLGKNRWLLNELAASLHQRPLTAITSAEVLALLRPIEKSGRRETARRLRGKIGAVYRFAIINERAENDPTYALRGALLKPKVTHRAAITDERELGALLCSIDEYHGWPTVRLAILFMALTMARPGDVRRLRKREVNFIKAVWNVPADRLKMRRPHDVPLSKQAIAVLKEAWEYSGPELVFPSIVAPVKPISENAMNSALRRMGYTKDEVSAHGFRTSASTILNDRGYDRDWIEAALSHQDEDEIRAAYNRTSYFKQRIQLMQDWADLLDAFRREALRQTA